MTPADLMKQYMDDTSDEAVEWIKYAGWLESRCCDLTRYKEGMEKLEGILKENEYRALVFNSYVGDGEYIIRGGMTPSEHSPSLLACIEAMKE